MKWIIAVPALFLLLSSCALAVNLSGNLSGTYGPGDYYVVGEITVPSNQSVTLRPGTRFLFTGHYKLTVKGHLYAIGTAQDSITFTRAYPTEASKWWGIRLAQYASTNSCQLEYCTIEFGRATGSGSDAYGGGIYFGMQSQGSVSNCIIRNNSATDGGGVAFPDNPVVVNLTDCAIEQNSASGYGGALFVGSGVSLQVSDCQIQDNEAADGGGIWCYGSSPILTHCVLNMNRATSRGGGIYLVGSSSLQLLNCDLVSNSCSAVGQPCGGIYVEASQPIVSNTIIAFSQGAGLIFVGAAGNSIFEYCDIFGNTRRDSLTGGPPNMGVISMINQNGDSCDVFGNIFFNPLFADTAARDYHLTVGSPCIDAGNPYGPADPDSSIADIGAFYYEQLLTVSPLELDFGGVNVGASGLRTLRVRNDGDEPITIQSVTTTSPRFTTNFSSPGTTLEAHDSLNIGVYFAPDTCRNFGGTLQIETSYLDRSVALFGLGLGGYVSVSPASLDLGCAGPNYAQSENVTIYNLGNTALTLFHPIAVSPFSTTFYTQTVTAGGSGYITVQFLPPDSGRFSGTLTVISDAFNNDSVRVSLSGLGELDFAPSPVQNLIIQCEGSDARIRWNPVRSTIHGNPLTVDAYLVYFAEQSEGPFWFLAMTTDTNCFHRHVVQFADGMYYQVTAYVGSILKLMEELPRDDELITKEVLATRLR